MRWVLAAVVLGGSFGSAEATVETIEGGVMVVVIEVEVEETAESVVAHLNFDGEPELTLPLLSRGGGVFGIRAELEPKNYVVVFEVVGAEGQVSRPVTLTELGADLVGDSEPPDEDQGLSPESRRLLWLAVALGAASLSLLAFWVLGGREDTPDGAPPVVVEHADEVVVEAEHRAGDESE